jgi:O-antigen ligase
MRLKLFTMLSIVTLIVIPSWLDPINLPKLLFLLVLTPLIAWQPTLFFWKNRALFTPIQQLVLVALALIPLTVLLAVAVQGPSLRSLFGTWGRNNGVLSITALMLVALSAICLSLEQRFLHSFLTFSSILIGISGLYGLLQLLNLDPIDWVNSGPKLIGFFGNSNFASSIWALGAGFSLFACLLAREWKLRAFFLSISFFLAFISFKTQSIQGPILVTIFAFCALFIFIPINYSLKRIIFLSLSIISFALFLFGIYGLGPIGNSLRSNSVVARFNYWEAAWNMFKANPLFGVGADRYGDFYRAFRSDGAAASLSIDVTTNNAHNAILHLLSTVGMIGVLPILVIFTITLVVSIRSILRRESSKELKIASTLFTGSLLMSLFSIDNLAVAIWIWSLTGIVLGLSLFSPSSDFNEINSKASKKTKRSATFNTPIVVSLASGILFVTVWSYAFPDRKIVEILNSPAYSNDLNSLDSRRDRLVELSKSVFFHEQHAVIAMQALNEIGKTSDAIDLGLSQISDSSREFTLLNYTAFLLEESRRYPEAIQIRKKQLDLDERHGGVWLAIAFDAREAGMQELSDEALRKARLNSKYMGENFEARIQAFFPSD